MNEGGGYYQPEHHHHHHHGHYPRLAGYYPYSYSAAAADAVSKYYGSYPSSAMSSNYYYQPSAMRYYGYPSQKQQSSPFSSAINFGSLFAAPQQQRQQMSSPTANRPYALPVNSRILAAIAANAGPNAGKQPLIGYLSKPAYTQQLARSGADEEEIQRAAEEAALADGPFVYLVPEEQQQQGAF